MGLNMDYKEQLDELFTLVNSMYDRGARNFLFVNVPPTDRSPAARNLLSCCRLTYRNGGGFCSGAPAVQNHSLEQLLANRRERIP